MNVKIGQTYYVKFQTTQLMDLISAYDASDDLRSKYPFYVDLIDKPVVLTSIHPGYGSPGDPWYTEDTGVVTLQEGSNFWLRIKTKHLYQKRTLDTCTCPLATLMCAGCKCGAIKKEKKK